MDDVTAGRQHDVRGRAALLADQLERAGVVGLVGEHPPHQPAIDDRQILAIARRQRQHPLSWNCGRWRRNRRDRCDRRWHNGRLGQWRRDRSRPRRRRQIHGWRGLDIRNRGRRHRWRAVREHLGRNRGRKHAASAKASSRQAPAPGKAIRPARIQRYRYRPRSWPCFSPKTRQIQASVAEVRPAAVAEPAPAPNVNACGRGPVTFPPRPLSPGINHAGGSEWTRSGAAAPRRISLKPQESLRVG